jgi:ribosomal protein S19E (S16A)
MRRKKPFITVEELAACFPTKFSKPSRAIRSMEILEKNGFVNKVGDGWRINLTGYDYLRSIAKVSGFVRDNDGHY